MVAFRNSQTQKMIARYSWFSGYSTNFRTFKQYYYNSIHLYLMHGIHLYYLMNPALRTKCTFNKRRPYSSFVTTRETKRNPKNSSKRIYRQQQQKEQHASTIVELHHTLLIFLLVIFNFYYIDFFLLYLEFDYVVSLSLWVA